AVGKPGRNGVAHRAELRCLQQPIDTLPLVLAFAPRERLARAAIAFEREPQVVLDAMAVEDRGFLELAPDPELGDLGLVEAGEVEGPAEIHFAAVRSGLAGDDVHHRGLAGAVRAGARPPLA